METTNTILLSIKPKYCDLILSQKKTVELRRAWAAKPVEIIVIYSSSPIMKIVGVVKVKEVVKLAPRKLWEQCDDHGSGVTKKEFLNYFEGKALAVGVFLRDATEFKIPINPHEVFENFSAPQSFRYVSKSELEILKQKVKKKIL